MLTEIQMIIKTIHSHRLVNEYCPTITETENRLVNKTGFHSSIDYPSFHFPFLPLPLAPLHKEETKRYIIIIYVIYNVKCMRYCDFNL